MTAQSANVGSAPGLTDESRLRWLERSGQNKVCSHKGSIMCCLAKQREELKNRGEEDWTKGDGRWTCPAYHRSVLPSAARPLGHRPAAHAHNTESRTLGLQQQTEGLANGCSQAQQRAGSRAEVSRDPLGAGSQLPSRFQRRQRTETRWLLWDLARGGSMEATELNCLCLDQARAAVPVQAMPMGTARGWRSDG